MKPKLSIRVPEEQVERVKHIPGPFFSNSGAVTGYRDALEEVARVAGMPALKAEAPVVPVRLPPDVVGVTRPYQQTGIQRAVRLCEDTNGALIADDMGLGKTRSAIGTAHTLSPGGLWVIACPASVRMQWKKELQLLRPWRDETCLVVDASKKLEKLTANHNTIITSFELTSALTEKLARHPDVLIIDEIHNLMGREKKYGTAKGTVRSGAVRELAVLSSYRIGLTGTPEPSRPANLWQQLHILWPWRFGKPFDFDVRYCNGQHNGWGFEAKGATNQAELKRRLSKYMIRRTKAEVALELPAITRVFRTVDADPKARALFQRYESTEMHRSDALANALLATHEGKMKEAVATCLQLPNFLLLTYRKEHAYKMAADLQKQGVNLIVLTGDLPPDKRGKLLENAQASKQSVVATIDACKEGLNMQGITNNGVMHALDWQPSKLMQAEARIHRMGQKLPVTWVYILMAESADMWVADRVVKRLDTVQATIPGTSTDGSAQLRQSLNQAVTAGDNDVLAAIYNDTKGVMSDE